MRNSRQFQQVLNAAARAARENAKQQHRLTEAFHERYGITHSDVDADELIDSLDYGGKTPTVAEADEIMTRCGHPPRARTDRSG